MALRNRIDGWEPLIVASMSVVMWLGICLLFGVPWIMAAIIGFLLFVGGVAKTPSGDADSSTPAPDAPGSGRASKRRRLKKGHPDESIYGPPE